MTMTSIDFAINLPPEEVLTVNRDMNILIGVVKDIDLP
jgi:hypothetical protein